MIGDLPQAIDWRSTDLHEFEGILLHRDVPLADAALHFAGRLVYLATPYSKLAVDASGAFNLARSIHAQTLATSWALRFAAAGVTALAPITLAGDMIFRDRATAGAQALDPLHHAFWEAWCRPMLSNADAVVIPPIPGWDQSRGVWREALAALGAMKPVYLLGEQ